MKLGDLLPVFAATDAASTSVERNGRFTEFPDEEPTVKQMSDWLDVNLPVITKAHGEMMRGALPPALMITVTCGCFSHREAQPRKN